MIQKPLVRKDLVKYARLACMLTETSTQIRFIQLSPCVQCVPVCLFPWIVDYLLHWSAEQMVSNVAIIPAFLRKYKPIYLYYMLTVSKTLYATHAGIMRNEEISKS